MAGKGTRVQKNEFQEPKPLLKVLDKTIMEWAIESIRLDGNFIFCCRQEHIQTYNIDKKLKQILPDCEIVSIDYQTQGPVQTILEAKKLINNQTELIISDSDHYLTWDSEVFDKNIRNQNIDACVMVFPDEQNSNSLSYVKTDSSGFVIKAAEKEPISKIASVGLHYFKKGSDFIKYSNKMIEKNLKVNNEFYVTPIYNEMIHEHKKIITFPIIQMWSLGTNAELLNFSKNFESMNENQE